jgi:hypothetical protein
LATRPGKGLRQAGSSLATRPGQMGACLLLLALLSLAVWTMPGSAKQGAEVVRVSADPYSNPGAEHATEMEPDSFATNSTVVTAFMVGKWIPPTRGASNIGFATSREGGHEFENGFLPGITEIAGGIYERVADPSVAYDAAHRTWLISSQGGTSGSVLANAVVVSRSSDGLHWSDPVTVASAGRPAGGLDKDWTVCDNSRQSPFFGHCYTTFDDVLGGFRLKVSTSTDGGKTWGPALETEDHAAGQGGVPVVQRDGTVVVPVVGPGDPFLTNPNLLEAFRSTDGGETWSAPVTVSQIGYRPPSGLPAAQLPSAEADRAGEVYLVWHDCRFRAGCSANDLVLSQSADGVGWTPPARVPIDPITSGADHFIPGLAVDPHTAGDHGRLALTYYTYPRADCTPDTCELDIGFISSSDGGATWSEPAQLAGPMSLDWLVRVGRGPFVGDYISTSFMHEHAFPFFAEANPPSGGAFDQAIATVPGGLHVGGSPRP